MIGFTIRERGPTPKLAMRQMNQVQREVGEELGDHWHQHFRPKHFTHAGATEYGYTPRQFEYTRRKFKTEGHTLPLVGPDKRGEVHSKDASRIRDVRVTATKGEAKIRVVLHTPKLNFRPEGGRIDLRDEMSRISANEGKQLAHIAGVQQAKRFRDLRNTTSTTI